MADNGNTQKTGIFNYSALDSHLDTNPVLLIGLESFAICDSRISGPENAQTTVRDTVPKPLSVMRKSMILPGWGQVVNRQIWKVPIVYGMLAGLTYYSIVMDQNYRDYRAAFYNSQSINDDERFGPTPPHIDPNQNPESLRYTRNIYRNRRDLTFVGIVLAYGLNVVDAYVFAHMRDFDVSDDLSARFYIEPAISPGRNTSPDNRGMMVSGVDGVVVTFKLNLP